MKIDRNTFFREVTLRISSSLVIEEALRAAFDYISRYIPSDTIGLHRVDTEQRCIFAVAEVAREGFIRTAQEDQPVVSMDDEMIRMIEQLRAHKTVTSIYNRPLEKLPRSVLQCFPELQSRSLLNLHLLINDEPIGGLILSKEGHDQYTPEHAALLEEVKEPVALAMSHAWRYHELSRLRDALAEDKDTLAVELQQRIGGEIIGGEFGLSSVMEMVHRVSTLNSPVLLLGETGTGKEVIANAIHSASPRKDAPMVRVQCGAIPETLLDSELFGHEKGAFTGATERKRGRFERARNGTIFLDEIGELSPEAQVKLLRVLQERQYERIGSSKTLKTEARVITATHRDLAAMVREGTFREDLWYRLHVFPIHIPPLRMRRDDIPALANYFVTRKAREMNVAAIPRIDTQTMETLQTYDWPGNVRELENVIERALILSRGETLEIPPLGSASNKTYRPMQAHETFQPKTLDAAIADHIRKTLAVTGGRVAGAGGAAELLNMHPSTLRFRMKKYGIEVKRQITSSIE